MSILGFLFFTFTFFFGWIRELTIFIHGSLAHIELTIGLTFASSLGIVVIMAIDFDKRQSLRNFIIVMFFLVVLQIIRMRLIINGEMLDTKSVKEITEKRVGHKYISLMFYHVMISMSLIAYLARIFLL